ncbi:MAG: polysaccharide biosynthesis protein, partial [Dokdonella sp.]
LFLDGPAVKGSPDARILSELADYVVLVAGSGRDTPDAVRRAMAAFDPAKVAGTVFNELP